MTAGFLFRSLLLLWVVGASSGMRAWAAAEPRIGKITVRGNAKVEADAVLGVISSKAGEGLSSSKVQADIRALYQLGFFSRISVFKVQTSDHEVDVIFEVAERPAITKISFEGFDEVGEDTLKDKLKTKLYTIVNDGDLTADLRMIEKEYADRGFYLARALHVVEPMGTNEVGIKFVVREGTVVRIGDVHILGNQYFTDAHIIADLALRPYTRSSSYSSSTSPGASLFKEDFLRRDLEYLSFIYQDEGFADVKVAKPLRFLDPDREFVRLTFQVEEGVQYFVESVQVTGDLLFPESELLEAMKLKPNGLFRYSQFHKDIEMLIDKYGDLGYAFVDVNPKTSKDKDKRRISINYEITKGDKVYFGDVRVVGNAKTRDNVVRRELQVHDAALYSGTGLTKSKEEVERLGFFEEVQFVKQRDAKDPTLLHVDVRVKEKPTGQLQAAIGFVPSSSSAESSLTGQGRYDEKNQSGYGYEVNLTGRWNGARTYDLELGFFNPRIYDGDWSSGASAFFRNQVETPIEGIEVQERRIGATVNVGRRIIELIRGTLYYRIEELEQSADTFILRRFLDQGRSSGVTLSLSRQDLNNRLDPSAGSTISVSQGITGGPILGGDHEFMESKVDGSYYIPIDVTDRYRMYLRLHGLLAHIYPLDDKPVPFFERYRFGGYNDMRGFRILSVGPKFNVLQAPGGRVVSYNQGGDKKALFQFEYFVPLIPEAGIKAILFTDVGRIFSEEEAISLTGYKQDLGFGLRWITPIAPFRFEWAYPIIDGQLGDMEFIFSLGY